jgi:hypothetical protein
MGYGEHNLNHLAVTIIYNRMVLTSAELTAVVCTLEYLQAYFTPVLGISISILRAYWHMYHLLSAIRVSASNNPPIQSLFCFIVETIARKISYITCGTKLFP